VILQQLFADSVAILQDNPTPPMYDDILVQWEVRVTPDGQFAGLINLGDKGGVRHCVPYNYGRSVDVVPNLLVDTADYALGVLDKNAAKKHEKFLQLLGRCAKDTGNPLVQTLLKFLQSGGVPAEQRQDLKAKDRIMFTVAGERPTDSLDVRQFWDQLTQRECKDKEKTRGRCQITGAEGYVENILPCEISIDREKAPLISVNEAAGNSYGFEQALNGAVSRTAAEGFTKALSSLMRNPACRLFVGDVTYVFWNRLGPDIETPEILMRKDNGTELVKKLLNTPFQPDQRPAERTAKELLNKHFVLALSGNKTRVVFRDWLAIAEWEIKDNIRSWILAQKIVSPSGDEDDIHYFNVFELAAAAYREYKEIQKADVPALVRSALHGDPIPIRMLAGAVRRCCLDKRVTHSRAALLKLGRTRNDKEKMQFMATHAEMERFNDNPAYVCGRLLALLESLQRTALESVNSNVIDRFFGAAAAEPRRILAGMLLVKAENAYLGKLRRQKPGLYFQYKDEMEHLLNHIGPKNDDGRPTFPRSLSIEEQADFLLGYYHQDSAYRTKLKENIDRRKKAAERSEGARVTDQSAVV
jgi:CRISPR-associated protein Csd1